MWSPLYIYLYIICWIIIWAAVEDAVADGDCPQQQQQHDNYTTIEECFVMYVLDAGSRDSMATAADDHDHSWRQAFATTAVKVLVYTSLFAIITTKTAEICPQTTFIEKVSPLDLALNRAISLPRLVLLLLMLMLRLFVSPNGGDYNNIIIGKAAAAKGDDGSLWCNFFLWGITRDTNNNIITVNAGKDTHTSCPLAAATLKEWRIERFVPFHPPQVVPIRSIR